MIYIIPVKTLQDLILVASSTLTGRIQGRSGQLSLISKGSRTLNVPMEDLMNGIPVEAANRQNIDFTSLEYEDAAVWGLLYTTGYLKADST